MKTLTVPARDPTHEVLVDYDLGAIYSHTLYNFTYRKCWPCEDGVYTVPQIIIPRIGSATLINYLKRWVTVETLRATKRTLNIL